MSLLYARVICAKEEWVNLSSQEFTEVQILLYKLKLKLYRKNKECILVIDFIYMYSKCSVKLNIDKKNHRHEGYAKMHNISGNSTSQSSFSYWVHVGQISIVTWAKPVKTSFCSKCFVWKIMESRPTLWSKTYLFYNLFRMIKKSSKSM